MKIVFQNLNDLKIYGTTAVNEALHACMAKLKPVQRLAIQLRFWEELEIEQMAVVLNMSWSAVDQLLESTFVELRKLLECYFESQPLDHAA